MYQRIASPAAVHVSMHPAALARPWGAEGNKNSSMGIIIIVLWPVHVVYFLYTSYYSNYVWHLVIERWSLNVVIYILYILYIWKIAFYSIDKWSLLSSIHEPKGKWDVSWGVHQNFWIHGMFDDIGVVGGWALPLWKIWVRQLGLWNSQLNGEK